MRRNSRVRRARPRVALVVWAREGNGDLPTAEVADDSFARFQANDRTPTARAVQRRVCHARTITPGAGSAGPPQSADPARPEAQHGRVGGKVARWGLRRSCRYLLRLVRQFTGGGRFLSPTLLPPIPANHSRRWLLVTGRNREIQAIHGRMRATPEPAPPGGSRFWLLPYKLILKKRPRNSDTSWLSQDWPSSIAGTPSSDRPPARRLQ